MFSVNEEKCTGCGQCLDICTVGAITLVKGKAVIDPDTCIFCGACLYARPQAAISEAHSPETAITAVIQPAETRPANIEMKKPVPASKPVDRWAWAMPVVAFVGKEIIPRLMYSFLDSWDRRLSASPKHSDSFNVEIANSSRGQRRQARLRRRGRRM